MEIRYAFTRALPQEFAKLLSSVIANSFAPNPLAHGIIAPIFREETLSTSHFH